MLRLLCCFLVSICGVLAQHVVFTKEDGLLSLRDKLNVYLFHADTHRLILRDESDLSQPKYGNIQIALQNTACVAGVNGGFFGADSKGTPLGLLVENGKKITPLAHGSFAVAGVLYSTPDNKIHLVRSHILRDMKQQPVIQTAVQGGPFLVENNKIVAGLNDIKATYRTFVATDGHNRWCIGISSPLTLKKLANWLVQPEALGDFKVHTALNLDGGSSSAFWCKSPSLSYPAFKRVRNYLGIVPIKSQ